MIIKIPFHSCAKLTVNDSDIDKVFGSMYQHVITKKKKKKFVGRDWIVKTIVEDFIKISEC